MLQDSVTFEAQLLRTDRYGHLDMVHFPFCPCAAIHPYTAVLHPFLVFHLVDSGQYGIQTNLVSSVRVSQVTGDKHLIRLDLEQQRLYDILVGLTQIILFH